MHCALPLPPHRPLLLRGCERRRAMAANSGDPSVIAVAVCVILGAVGVMVCTMHCLNRLTPHGGTVVRETSTAEMKKAV